MAIAPHPVKGIHRHLLDGDLGGEPLHMHVSEVAGHERSHAPHQHGGIEAIYMFEGECVLEVGDEANVLKAGESIVFDPRKMHWIRNDTDRPMRYMVVLYRDAN